MVQSLAPKGTVAGTALAHWIKKEFYKNVLESYMIICGGPKRRTQPLINTPQKPLFEKVVFHQNVESLL